MRVSGSLKACGSAVDVAALRARRLALGDAPEDVEVAVEIDAIAFGPRVVAAVLPPQGVDVHDVLAPVGVHAGHEPEIERLQDQLYFGRRPGAIAIRDVAAVFMTDEQVDGELDDGVGVHEFAGMRATNDHDTAALTSAARAQA